MVGEAFFLAVELGGVGVLSLAAPAEAEGFVEKFVVHHELHDVGRDFKIVEGAADHHRVADPVVMPEFPAGERTAPEQLGAFHLSLKVIGIDSIEDLVQVMHFAIRLVDGAAEHVQFRADGLKFLGPCAIQDVPLGVYIAVEDVGDERGEVGGVEADRRGGE